MENLKQHTYGSIPSYQGRASDSKTSSKNSSRDNQQQRVMNAEVTLRDGNKCVICGDASSLFAAQIFEVRDTTPLDTHELLELKLLLKIQSLYSVNNGFALCNLCHTMYDYSILSIRVDENGSYFVECDPACATDPLFSYKEHAAAIDRKALRIPVKKFREAWPPIQVVEWRYKDNQRNLNERNQRCDSMEFECTRCGEVFSTERLLTNHLVRSKRKCTQSRDVRKPGMYGGFDKVKSFNQVRHSKCKHIVKNIFYGGKRSSSVHSSFVSAFSEMSAENNSA